MQVRTIHHGAAAALCLVSLASLAPPAAAGGGDPVGGEAGYGAGAAAGERQRASYTWHYFADSDNVHVTSRYADYNLALDNGASFDVEWNDESVLIPPVEAPRGSDEAADAITSASRPITGDGAFDPYRKNRDAVTATAAYAHSEAGYYVSVEEDYLAQQVSGSVDRDFRRQTLNLSASTSYGWDVLTPLADDDTPAESDSKSNVHVGVALTAVLTPTSLIRFGAELNEVRGHQQNSYRNVYAGGGARPELHPDRRTRRDFFVRCNRYFGNRSSINLTYKYYTDDWGIDSHTVGARLNQYLTRRVIVAYRYRYYSQSAAWFYMDEYPDEDGIDGYRTGDYRMSPFDAHLFGSRLDWVLADGVYKIPAATRPRLVCKYERYFNSNNFSANVFESGLAVSFP